MFINHLLSVDLLHSLHLSTPKINITNELLIFVTDKRSPFVSSKTVHAENVKVNNIAKALVYDWYFDNFICSMKL